MREKHVLGQTCHGLDNCGQKDTEASIIVRTVLIREWYALINLYDYASFYSS